MPRWHTRPLLLGSTGGDVEIVQRRLGATPTGEYDEDTLARVRGVQRRNGLPETGIVDAATADAIGERSAVGLPPDWWGTDEQQVNVRRLIGDSSAVRRLQSSLGLVPTGEVDRDLAIRLADLGY